jgi:hypothetical protein
MQASRADAIAALASLAVITAAACARSRCTDVPAETREFELGSNVLDGGEDVAAPPSLADCRRYCADTAPDDPAKPHVTSCNLFLDDAGLVAVACKETPYQLCAP